MVDLNFLGVYSFQGSFLAKLQISLVASAIMRVAMFEIMYMPDIPHGVAINEAVNIAKNYEEPETAKFVNGILGSFAREEIKD